MAMRGLARRRLQRAGRWIAAALVALAATVQSQPAPSADALRWSDAVLAALRSGVVTSIDARLDDTMRAALPPAGLVAVFESLHQRLGVLRTCATPSTRTSGDVTIVDHVCQFANGPQTVRTAWTPTGRLAGLFVVPAPSALALPAGLREEPIVTGSAGWPLPGLLMSPSKPGSLPIVVLVHGSGPNDRDETIGPNKPFRDLAWGLGTRGISSLRYDKRTLTLRDRFQAQKDWTVDDEVVDDAVAALAVASYRSGAGPVFVVGHSEGALLAPRIAEAARERGVAVAGIVMLAAPLTPLADLEVEQYAYLAGLPDSRLTIERLADVRARRENLRLLVAAGDRAGAGGAPPLPDGQPASFWLDLQRYDPAKSLLDQPQLPALLVFGGRDYQVPIRELALWKARLGERPLTRLTTFPAINHLLIEGSGPMTPAEYAQPGRVSPALIDAVADWIHQQVLRGR